MVNPIPTASAKPSMSYGNARRRAAPRIDLAAQALAEALDMLDGKQLMVGGDAAKLEELDGAGKVTRRLRRNRLNLRSLPTIVTMFEESWNKLFAFAGSMNATVDPKRPAHGGMYAPQTK